MAKVRKREWVNPQGKKKVSYVVDYKDMAGVRRTPQFPKAHQAEDFKRKVEREIFEGIHVPEARAVTFADLADTFLRDCDRRRKIKDRMSGNSYDLAVRLVTGHLVPAFGKMKITDIAAKHVRDFVNVKAEKYARVTIVKLVVHLREILQFAVRDGELKRNIVRDDPPRIPLPPTERIEIPSLDALRRLVTIIETTLASPARRFAGTSRRQKGNGPLQTAIVVYAALTAGMRRGEICGLHWQNLDFGNDAISVEHSVSRFDGLKGQKSKAGVRKLPMVPMLKRRLLELHEACGYPEEGLVIQTYKGTPVAPDDLVRWFWQPIAKAADVRRKDGTLMGLHALRHAAASLWIMAEVPELALKAAIGHASISFTKDVYGHLFKGDGEGRRRLMDSSVPLLAAD